MMMFTDFTEHDQLAKFYLLQNIHCHLQLQNNKGGAQKDRAVPGGATSGILGGPREASLKTCRASLEAWGP